MSILSVDIGGTFIKYALMSRNGNIISRGKIATPKEGRDELVETIGRLFDEMPDVEGIAICMPGMLLWILGGVLSAAAALLCYTIKEEA